MTGIPLAKSFHVTWSDDGTPDVTGERENGQVQCPKCGTWQTLIEQADGCEWEGRQITDVFWGPGMADCCGLLLVSDWNGAVAYVLLEDPT